MATALRFTGWFFLAIGISSLALDLALFYEREGFRLSLLGQNWYDIHPSSLNLIQAVTERYVSQNVWDYILSPLLFMPTLIVGCVAGGLLVIAASILSRREEL